MQNANTSENNPQAALRSSAKRARERLGAAQRKKFSREIADRVLASDNFRRSTNIACYVPMATEVDTWPIIQRAWAQKKRVFVPVTQKKRAMQFCRLLDESDLETNTWGLREPKTRIEIEIQALDLVIAPLVAFDTERNRIGMGGGYYDRAFSHVANADADSRTQLAGVAFDCQRVEKIAPNPWDIRLFQIFTETRVL